MTAPRRGPSLTDAAEDLGDLFEETLRHRLAADPVPSWSAGTVVPIAFGRLTPGTLGWSAHLVERTSDQGSSAGREIGILHLLLLPAATRDSGPGPPESPPFIGRSWTDFIALEMAEGPPRMLVLAEATAANDREGMARFAHGVVEQLRNEID